MSFQCPFPCSLCGAPFFASALLEDHHRNYCPKRSRECTLDSLVVGGPDNPTHVQRKRLRVSLNHFLPLGALLQDDSQSSGRDKTSRKVPSTPPCPPDEPRSLSQVPPLCTPPNGATLQAQGTLVDAPPSPAGQMPDTSPASAQVEDRPPLRRSRRLLNAVANRLPEPLAPNLVENALLAKHTAMRNERKKPCFRQGDPNIFGLRRRYYGIEYPKLDPEQALELKDLYKPSYNVAPGSTPDPSKPIGPFPNLSSFQLGEWYLNAGAELSLESLKDLVTIAQNPGFAEDVSKVNWKKTLNALSASKDEITASNEAWLDDDGWKQTPVSITLPLKGGLKEDITAGVLHHRSIVSIVRDKIANTTKGSFHYEPFELSWQPDAATPATRVRSELYNSDAFIKAHHDLQNSPPVPGCQRERVVVGLMFWSDETQLTNFSAEGIWPCYMQFANESKYERCEPTSNLAHHVAFFEKVSDDFQDYIEANLDQTNEDAFRSYCKQGMFQGQWMILLDDELLEAMENGLVIGCPDNIERRFYIRVFTYSADYMEKVLIATLRKYPSKHPCPRCLVEKDRLDQMGTREDMATRERTNREDDEQRRNLITEAQRLVFEENIPFGDSKIDALLKSQSYHPVTNAFSALTKFDFNIFTSLTVDLLHEYEIGVWKAVFIHLLRILSAKGDDADSLTHSLNKRYRLVPAFGRRIRRFSQKHNVSEMKKKAARDFEDMLQCAIPVFDGLLPDPAHDKAVLSLLSICAEWHALAKLRMHTDNTLDLLEDATQDLANELRGFIQTVCSQIQTEELAAEVEAREKREARKAEKKEIERQKAENKAKKQANKNSKASQLASTQASKGKGKGKGKGKKSASSTQPSLLERQAHEPRRSIRKTDRQAADTVAAPEPSEHPLPSSSEPQVPATSTSLAAGNPPHDQNPTKDLKERATKKRRKPKLVKLNICTPKFHFLGDYVKYIRLFGTTDNYSTQLGELLHRYPKKWYKKGPKRNARRDVGRYERRIARIRQLRRNLDGSQHRAKTEAAREQKEAAMNAEIHHYIGESQAFPVDLSTFDLHRPTNDLCTLGSSSEVGDPLGAMFIANLREDLLPRIAKCIMAKHRELVEEEGLTCELHPAESYDPSAIVFKDRRIYAHRITRIKYTTYDVRRLEDVVHVDSDVCNIMLPNQEYLKNPKASPYKYGRVLGVYHAYISYTGEIAPGGVRYLKPTKMEFLLVRWYSHVPSEESVPVAMDRLCFPPITSPDATEFIDPSAVLRAAHIIPRFALGVVHTDGQGLSELGRDSSDWKEYFVNRYADRDMYMRYCIGLAPGHTGIWPSQLALRELQAIQASPRRRPEGVIPQHQNKGKQTEDGDKSPEDEDEDEDELNDSEDDCDDRDSVDGEGMDVDENDHDEEMYGYDSS